MLDSIAMTDRGAMGLGALTYLAAFLFGLGAILARRPYPRAVMFAFLTGGFLMQTLGLNLRGAAIGACPLGNPFEIAQFIGWSLVLFYFVIGPLFRLRLLGFFTAGLATAISGGAFLVPGWDHPYPPGIFGGDPWIEMHAALAVFSYGAFSILTVVSAMFLIQQHGLKQKHTRGIYQYLPSVRQLDAMAKRLLVTGVAVFTVALCFGAVFWLNAPERVPLFKLSATGLVWIGYMTVFGMRLRKKLVTRRHALACILLFAVALAALWPVETARSGARPAPTDQPDTLR